MSFPKGRNLPISLPRRLMCDFLHFSKKVPLVCVERLMDLGPLYQARQALTDRPSWFTLFLKAFALSAQRWPELRTSFMSFPWPHLHVHEGSIGGLPIERQIGDEAGVLFLQVSKPDQRPLTEIDALIRAAKTQPLESIGAFRRQLLIGNLPFLLRRLAWWVGLNTVGKYRARFYGTFGVTGVANLGAASVHFLTPLTSTLAFGVIHPDGCVNVRLMYDHRVMDGVVPARALEDIENALNGQLREEVCEMGQDRALEQASGILVGRAS